MATWVELSAFQKYVGNTKDSDAEVLQVAIDLGCAKVDELCGPTITTSVTEYVDGGGYELPLLKGWPTSITSITETRSGAVLDADDFITRGQILRRHDRDWIEPDLTVVYSAGATTAPRWAVSAAMAIAKQWLNGRLGRNPQDPTTLTGFLVPKQATEIMHDHLLAPEL